MPFNVVLIKLRTERGMTQEELSKATGIGRSAIGNYENGSRMPSTDVLNRFADFFEVDLDTLLGRKPIEKNEQKQDFIEWLSSLLTPKGKMLLEKHLITMAMDPENLDPNAVVKDVLLENLTPEALEKRKALARELRIQKNWAKAMERESRKKQKPDDK